MNDNYTIYCRKIHDNIVTETIIAETIMSQSEYEEMCNNINKVNNIFDNIYYNSNHNYSFYIKRFSPIVYETAKDMFNNFVSELSNQIINNK